MRITYDWLNYTNYFIKVPLDPQSVATPNAVIDTAYILCRKCKKNCHPEFFANPSSTSLYATCLNCRTQEHARHFPHVFEPIPNLGQSDFIGKIFTYYLIGLLMKLLD